MFDKNRRTSSLNFSVSYEKDTTKDSEAKQLILNRAHTEPNRNKPGEIRYFKMGIVAYIVINSNQGHAIYSVTSTRVA